MRFILLAAQLILLDATQSAVTVGLDAFGIEVKITPDVSKDGDEGVECREDWQCPMARPICDRARLLCEDLYYFNSSRGSCVCDSPHDCDFEEILTQEVLSNVSDCVFACKVTPECRAFQGRYIPNSHKSNFSCQLLRALASSSTPATLTGDGQGDQYCYRKPDRSSECTHHLACLTSSGHFCCPDRHGEMLACCSSPSTIQAGGIVTTVTLIMLLALSTFFNCRTCGKSAIATPASDVPGSTDISFPGEIRGQKISYTDYAELRQAMDTAGRFVIAFVNLGSGDQSGKRFEELFRVLLGASGRVCKLPRDLDSGLNQAAEILRRNEEVAILACGGDGTVTWILSELNERKDRVFQGIMMPPVGIIPLGTGNDLARSLGWGPVLSDNFQLPCYVHRALRSETVLLDQWQLTLRPSHLLPPSLRQRGTVEFVGYFTNYFSVGMDACTSYEVGRVRSSPVGRCCFRLRCMPPCRFIHGGLLCYGLNGPNCARCLCCRTRALNEDLEVRFDNEDTAFAFKGQVRQFTLTNLNSYGAGMCLYGKTTMDTQVSPNDGKLEVFTREGPYGVIGMTLSKKIMKVPCADIPILRQPRRVEMELKKGQHFQMDGEAWVLNAACTAVVEWYSKVRMLCPGEDGLSAGDWSGSQTRNFWEGRRGTGVVSEQELCRPDT